MATHHKLEIWKQGIELVEIIYKLTNLLPEEEKYGLSSQIRRASVSIPSNIAEGAARNSNKEYIRFCYIAMGSLSEVETQLRIISRIYKLDIKHASVFLENYSPRLISFIKYLKTQVSN